MAQIVYFKQAREDGGVRTGIEFEELTYYETFENEAKERDPALRWWLDVRCEVNRPVEGPEEARQWLLEHGDFIRRGLKAFAEKLSVGLDRDYYPVQCEIPGPPEKARAVIVCSVGRRAAGREIGEVLLQIADRWEQEVKGLAAVHAMTL
jgi:hypothetical protein